MKAYIILVCGIAAVCAEPVIRPGKNDGCAKYCKSTYSAHTSESTADSVKACDQGCQLFALLQFGGRSKDSATDECLHACSEAYAEHLKAPCEAGCEHEAPFTGGHMEIHVNENSPLYEYMRRAMNMGMGDVFDSMARMRDNLMQQLGWGNPVNTNAKIPAPAHETQSSSEENEDVCEDKNELGQCPTWADNGECTANSDYMSVYCKKSCRLCDEHKEKPHLLGGDDGHDNWQHQMLEAPTLQQQFEIPQNGGVFDKEFDQIWQRMQRMHQRMQHILDETMRQPEIQQFFNNDGHDVNTLESVRAHEPSPPVVRYRGEQEEAGWLACLARRARRLSFVTRWMVCIAMLLCVASMLFICMAIMRTAPRRRVLMQARSTNASAYPYKIPPTALIDAEKKCAPPPDYGSQGNLETPAEPLVHGSSPPPPYETPELPKKDLAPKEV